METSELKALYDIMVESCHHTFRLTKSRRREVVESKQMFAVLARDFGAKYAQIAGFLDCSHSNTVLAVKRMRGYIEVYPAMKRRYRELHDEYEYRVHGSFIWVPD